MLLFLSRRVAEYGVAAHFDYKTLQGGSKLDHTLDAYLKSVEQLKGKNTLQPPSLGSFSLDPHYRLVPN